MTGPCTVCGVYGEHLCLTPTGFALRGYAPVEKRDSQVMIDAMHRAADWYAGVPEVREFGASVPFSGLDADTFGLYEAARERIREAVRLHHAAIDHLCHRGFGAETLPGCLLCSWAWRLHEFWATIAYALETCEGCGRVMYECGASCAFWGDY
jgi:hypothetical protein